MDTRTVCDETLSLRSRRLDASSGRKRERARARETREGVRISLSPRVSPSRAPVSFFFLLVPSTSKCLRKTQIFSLKLTCLIRTSVDCSDPCLHSAIFCYVVEIERFAMVSSVPIESKGGGGGGGGVRAPLAKCQIYRFSLFQAFRWWGASWIVRSERKKKHEDRFIG